MKSVCNIRMGILKSDHWPLMDKLKIPISLKKKKISSYLSIAVLCDFLSFLNRKIINNDFSPKSFENFEMDQLLAYRLLSLLDDWPDILNLTSHKTEGKTKIQVCRQQPIFAHKRQNLSATFMATFDLLVRSAANASHVLTFLFGSSDNENINTLIVRAAAGKIKSSGCDYRVCQTPMLLGTWGNCAVNIQFGYLRFQKPYMTAARRGSFAAILYAAGSRHTHVIREMRQECKCHGMSGSCTVKTCWRRLPYFRKVSNNIKARFDGASRVKQLSISNNNRQTNDKRRNRRRRKKSPQRGNAGVRTYPLKPFDPEHKPPTSMDLAYVDSSPDFCRKDKKLGLQGTKGRECNNTSDGVDGCDLMCCGRGYHTRTMEVKERCSCTFKWCCEVSCQICRRMKTTHTC
ncbi:unnamed protein product, partial [Meganyctiphanes norvegica]